MTSAYFKQSRRCVEKQPPVQRRRSFLKQDGTLAEGLAERKNKRQVSAQKCGARSECTPQGERELVSMVERKVRPSRDSPCIPMQFLSLAVEAAGNSP